MYEEGPTTAKAATDFESELRTKASAAEPEPKMQRSKGWAGFDEEDGEPISESEIEQTVEEEPEWLPEHGEGERRQDESGVVRKRLRVKTSPIDAPGYPQRPLLKKAEYRIAKGKVNVA